MTETMTRRLAPSGDDYAELRDLVERVAAGIDHRDAELFLSAFAPDARLLRLRPGTENEIIADQAPAESFASGPLKMSPEIETMHTICNARFEVDGDQARGEIYVIAFQFAPIGFSPDHLLAVPPGLPTGEPLVRMAYVKARDRYEKVDRRWRIAERRSRGEGNEVRPLNLVH